MMKNLFKKINWFGVIALIAVTTFVYASKSTPSSKRQDSVQYGRTASGWILVDDENFVCDQSAGTCKANFIGDPNNDGEMDTTVPTVEQGLYVHR